MKKYLTLRQVAEKLQIKKETLRRKAKNGEFLPAFKIGGSWRVDPDELKEYIEDKKTV